MKVLTYRVTVTVPDTVEDVAVTAALLDAVHVVMDDAGTDVDEEATIEPLESRHV
jgi:hypothetical protein